MARGYLGRPELTAEKFIPDLYGHELGARLYKTGDSARWRAEGNLEFLGRQDQQVKVRGYRIELGEIEAALGQHPGVREAVVLAREGTPENKQLVAYLVGQAGQGLVMHEVRQFLQERLPSYMVPTGYVELEALPLMPNGKLDRRALPTPDKVPPRSKDDFSGPHTPIEQVLVEIWVQVLGIEQVGIDDNFFELGGHSLLASQVLSCLYDTFQVELSLRVLFESPTVAALAERVKNSLEAEGTQVPPILPVAREALLPLSFAQQQLWLIEQLEPGNIAYNIPFPLRLNGFLDLVALRASLDEIVRRHEILRTTFVVVNTQPIQSIAPSLTLPLLLVDLSQLSEPRREAEAQRLAREESRCPFDLERGPLLRTTLIQLDRTEHLLLLTVHHIVADGWSMNIFVNELTAVYRALVTHRPSPLPELGIQYADFAVWQRKWLPGDLLAPQIAYWKQQLAGCPSLLALPTDRPRPAVQTFQGARHEFAVAESVSASLSALSRREGVTLFMTLLALFQTLLYRYTEQSDIVVGSPMANRRQRETEKLVGYFVNMLALRVRLEGGLTFRELLKRVRETTLNAYAHQDVPFERLVQVLGPERSLSYNPLFQTCFTFQNKLATASQLPSLSFKPIEIDPGTALFDLRLEISETDHGLSGFIEYNTDLFDRATAVEMLGRYQTLTAQVLTDPDQTLSALLASIKVERELSFRHKTPPSGPAVVLVDSMKDQLAQRRARLSARRAKLPAERQTIFQERLQGKSDDG